MERIKEIQDNAHAARLQRKYEEDMWQLHNEIDDREDKKTEYELDVWRDR